MGLWLLSFTEREVSVIVEAETLAHARLLAATDQVCRASLSMRAGPLGPLFRRKSLQILSDERFRKMRPPIFSAH